MEKKIILTVKENGQIKIEYPKDFTYMETIGLIDASKAILLNEYVNPREKDKDS